MILTTKVTKRFEKKYRVAVNNNLFDGNCLCLLSECLRRFLEKTLSVLSGKNKKHAVAGCQGGHC